jgi:hypothetical protein
MRLLPSAIGMRQRRRKQETPNAYRPLRPLESGRAAILAQIPHAPEASFRVRRFIAAFPLVPKLCLGTSPAKLRFQRRRRHRSRPVVPLYSVPRTLAPPPAPVPHYSLPRSSPVRPRITNSPPRPAGPSPGSADPCFQRLQRRFAQFDALALNLRLPLRRVLPCSSHMTATGLGNAGKSTYPNGWKTTAADELTPVPVDGMSAARRALRTPRGRHE